MLRTGRTARSVARVRPVVCAWSRAMVRTIVARPIVIDDYRSVVAGSIVINDDMTRRFWSPIINDNRSINWTAGIHVDDASRAAAVRAMIVIPLVPCAARQYHRCGKAAQNECE